jgi:hypothetical protein
MRPGLREPTTNVLTWPKVAESSRTSARATCIFPRVIANCHTGSTWSAQSGATLKELMARIGHSSTRAAMIYQHASRDRDDAIATALNALIVEARSKVTE